jgi:hypothetical protein
MKIPAVQAHWRSGGPVKVGVHVEHSFDSKNRANAGLVGDWNRLRIQMEVETLVNPAKRFSMWWRVRQDISML